MPNERVDLAQRQRRRRTAFEVPTQEAVRRHAEVERRFGGVVDDGRAVFLGEGEHAEDAADPGGPFVPVNVRTHRADMRASVRRPGEQGHGARRRPRGTIIIVEPVPAAQGTQMLTQELSRLRREQADVEIT